jgi:DNA-binding NarL/FixJ family response regulator
MNQGRSVDSCRFLSKRVPTIIDVLPHEGAWNEEIVEQPETETPLEDICARDTIEVLKTRVNSLEQKIISYLALGFGMREIARTIGVSHVCVVKHRRHIATVAIELGIRLARHTCPKSSKAV